MRALVYIRRMAVIGESAQVQVKAVLAQAAKDYENGAILEVRDVLADIVVAIDHFDLYN